ncbi:hypothetical protein LCGC14_0273670 [marine sediment metagenome]|uniref:Uncharacterized protein n=2 Tax=root TaxID=1 RepID=A0A9C9NIL1_9HYPH|nr:hypothetical protein [Aurantimonas coralicida]
MGGGNVLGLQSLQSVYERSGTAPHILNTVANGGFSVQQDLAAAVADIAQYRDALGVIQHSWQEDSLLMGPAVTDIFAASLVGVNLTPALFPTRPTVNFGLDVLRLIPTSRTFTSAVNKIQFGNGAVFTLDFPSATAAAALLVNPTIIYQQDGGGFGSGLVVNHSAIYEGGPAGSTRFIGPIFTFVHQPTFRANGAGSTVNHSQGRDFLSQPIHRVDGGATAYNMTGIWTQLFCSGQVRTGATMTFRRIIFCGALANATGIITDTTAILIDDLTPETTNPAMGIENNIGSPGIQYEGASGLWGIFAATPVGQQTVVGSRGGNAALASFLTAMENLGWIIDSTVV